MFFRSLAAIQAETCRKRLPIIPAENRPPIISATAIRNTGQHAETADQTMIPTADRRKYINHSGIIGNAIPGSANQQNPSDHDRLMTSNPNRHKYQTISNFCTVNFRITEKLKKRYIIRTYTQGSDLTGSESAETA